jgi:hypothetical protein
MKSILIACLCACVAVSAPAQTAKYRHDGTVLLNDLKVTPGKTDPSLTKNVICNPKFRTGPYRHTTESEKKAVCREYGAADCPNPEKGEIDHLVPLEDGGADVVANLWWQPASPVPGYHQKDLVENWVHKQICEGAMDMTKAQTQLEQDWVVLYREMLENK